MHSMNFTLPGVGPITILHNGDWSGDAIVCWDWVPDGPQDVDYPRGRYGHRVEMPGNVLIAIAKRAAASALSSALFRTIEQFDPGSIIEIVKEAQERRVPWHKQHLRECGTAYRGCAPDCPKEQVEQMVKAEIRCERDEIIDEIKEATENNLNALPPEAVGNMIIRLIRNRC